MPVKFVNEGLSPGLKRGGVLNIVRHEIEVYCPYDRIPAAFEINLEGMQIGRSIHVSFLELPEGVRPAISDRFHDRDHRRRGQARGGAGRRGGSRAGAAPAAAAPAAGGKAAAAPAAAKAAAPAAGKAAPAAKPAGKK